MNVSCMESQMRDQDGISYIDSACLQRLLYIELSVCLLYNF